MTKNETINLLTVIASSFPSYKPANLEMTVGMWQTMLDGYTYDQTMQGLVAFIKQDTKGFAPSIGQLINNINTISTDRDYPTPQEAWECLIDEYVSCSGDYKRAKENYENMPRVLQLCVGGPDTLNDMALMDLNSLNSVEKSHFIKTYTNVLNEHKERVKIRQSTNGIGQKENIRIEG